MGRTLHKRLLSEKFDGPVQEAILNLWVTASFVRGLYDGVFEDADLTMTQYNVLRILNGAHPEGYCRAEVARRMLDRASDLTRLIDRLVRRGLVQRGRSERDGRHSVARITPRGRQLLALTQPRVRAVEQAFAGRLTEDEALELSRLCEKIYGEEVARDS
ncbi:MAG: MarR family transcriptional regulator [Candidatus Eisenbacteria bacterium]|nr:MarR family transcriptional regulator [Candidatus Eisenbacteria bacterium]